MWAPLKVSLLVPGTEQGCHEVFSTFSFPDSVVGGVVGLTTILDLHEIMKS